MRLLFLGFALFNLFPNFAWAQQAVLIEEVAPIESANPPKVREESRRGSYLMESHSIRDIFREGNYESVEALRADRRVGVGVETLGRLGVIGFGVELNFAPLDAATAGIGGGPGYNSFNLGWKHVFGGSRFAPYTGLSFARWSGNSTSRFDGTTPAYLEDKFLSKNEKESGQFAKSFFVPSLGLQFNQLNGREAGSVLFIEILAMVESSTMDYAPTGSFGAQYYF